MTRIGLGVLSVAMALIALPSHQAISTLVGVLADAQRYDVNIKKIEVCTDATCSTARVVGQGSMTYDIAHYPPFSQVGSFAKIQDIPGSMTLTHIRLTVGPSFVIVAEGRDELGNPCVTTSSPTTASSHTQVGNAVNRSALPFTPANPAVAAPQVIFVPNLGSLPGANPTQADFDALHATKIPFGDVLVVYPLSSPYTTKANQLPQVRVNFNTRRTVRFYSGGGGGPASGCGVVYVGPPSVVMTLSD